MLTAGATAYWVSHRDSHGIPVVEAREGRQAGYVREHKAGMADDAKGEGGEFD